MSVIMRNDIEVGGTDDDMMAKVGTAQLTTTSKDLSGAVNELNSSFAIKIVNGFFNLSANNTKTILQLINSNIDDRALIIMSQKNGSINASSIYFIRHNNNVLLISKGNNNNTPLIDETTGVVTTNGNTTIIVSYVLIPML